MTEKERDIDRARGGERERRVREMGGRGRLMHTDQNIILLQCLFAVDSFASQNSTKTTMLCYIMNPRLVDAGLWWHALQYLKGDRLHPDASSVDQRRQLASELTHVHNHLQTTGNIIQPQMDAVTHLELHATGVQ